MKKTIRQLAAIIVKDLRSDSRAKEIAPTMILFAASLVFLFSFTLPPGAGRAAVPEARAGAVGAREIAGSILWISLLFAGVIGFGRSASADHEGSRIDGLILAPVDPAIVYAGKTIANLAFLTFLEAALLPIFILLLDVAPGLLFPQIIAVATAANIGLAAVGSLFAAASQYARTRSLMLPLLTFPVVIPLLLGASRLTSMLLATGGLGDQARWLGLLLVYDLIFVTIGAVTFEFVVQE